MARIDEDELIEHWTLIGGELAEVAPGIGARRGRCVGRFAVSRVAGWVAGRERRRAGLRQRRSSPWLGVLSAARRSLR